MSTPEGECVRPVGGLGQRLRDGELAIALALYQARTPDLVLMAAVCGFDAVSVDLEHSAISIETMSMLCTVARQGGLTPLVRIASGTPELVDRVLGIGPAGLIVSHVETAEQAEAIVRASHFPPQGNRSVGGTGVSSGFRTVDTATAVGSVESQVFVAAMVESRASVNNVEAIAAVRGMDMLVAGPHDLTTDMGIPGQFDHPEFLGAMSSVAAACSASGTVFGVAGIADLALLEGLVAKGLRYVSAGTDSGFFMQAASSRVRELRSLRR